MAEPSSYTGTARYGYSTGYPTAPYGFTPLGFNGTWPQVPSPPGSPGGTGEWVIRTPGTSATSTLTIGELSYKPSGFQGLYDFSTDFPSASYFVLSLPGTTTTLPLASGTPNTNPYTGNIIYTWTIPSASVYSYVANSYQPMSITLY
jgi:hypothetical protein